MQIGKTIVWWNRGSARNRLWIDVRCRSHWYVFIWRYGQWPFMFTSPDATPPCGQHGRMIFGSYND